jgi:hypothetical protein
MLALRVLSFQSIKRLTRKAAFKPGAAFTAGRTKIVKGPPSVQHGFKEWGFAGAVGLYVVWLYSYYRASGT